MTYMLTKCKTNCSMSYMDTEERLVAPLKISSKFQVVIPKGLREQLELQPGDELVGSVEGNALVLYRRPSSYARYLFGRLPPADTGT